MIRHTHTPTLDLVGASASTLCAIHCATLPLVATALPTLGLGWVSSGPIEWGLVSASGIIAFLALRKGHRIHGQQQPRLVALLGFLVVVISILLEPLGAWATVLRVLGGFTMVLGHVLNGLGCRVCTLKVDQSTRDAFPS
jgi:hypothetical protein